VRAAKAWMSAAGIHEGPLFRAVDRHSRVSEGQLNDRTVARTIKQYAAAIGLKAEDFSGHFLRAGFVTSAARAGEPERRIMRTTGHRSVEMVLRYVRIANAFNETAVSALGL
jgi:integrase